MRATTMLRSQGTKALTGLASNLTLQIKRARGHKGFEKEYEIKAEADLGKIAQDAARLETEQNQAQRAHIEEKRAHFVEEEQEEMDGMAIAPVHTEDELQNERILNDALMKSLERQNRPPKAEDESSSNPLSEFDDADLADIMGIRESMEDLEAALIQTYPNLPGAVVTVDPEAAALEAAVQAAKNPLLKFNGLLSGFHQPRQPTRRETAHAEHAGKSRAPKLVVVTGHNGSGGNAGLNGLYERHPNDFHGRPAYHKLMERREEMDPFEFTRHVHSRRDWIEHDSSTRLLLQRETRLHPIPPPRSEIGPTSILPALEPKFLFFDMELGGWCIGPKVGSREIFARCPGLEGVECIPFRLCDWEVWDAGMATWYSHDHMNVLKAGDC